MQAWFSRALHRSVLKHAESLHAVACSFLGTQLTIPFKSKQYDTNKATAPDIVIATIVLVSTCTRARTQHVSYSRRSPASSCSYTIMAGMEVARRQTKNLPRLVTNSYLFLTLLLHAAMSGLQVQAKFRKPSCYFLRLNSRLAENQTTQHAHLWR